MALLVFGFGGGLFLASFISLFGILHSDSCKKRIKEQLTEYPMMKYKPGKNPNLSTSEANQLAKLASESTSEANQLSQLKKLSEYRMQNPQ